MRLAGELAAVATALCWASGSTFFVAAGRRMGSLTLNRWRITVAMFLLGAALWITRGSPWPVWAARADVVLLALSGLIGFVFGDSFYFRALVILGAGRATLLTALSPLFTAVLARLFLGETLGLAAILGIALTVGGLVWVLYGRVEGNGHPEGSALVGVLSGILAAMGQSGGFVLSKLALRSGLDPLSATMIRVVAAVAALWLLTPMQGGWVRQFVSLRDRVATGAMLGGALFGPFLGVTLSLYALQHTEAGVAASIMASYPIPAVLLAARFHREELTLRTLGGALVTVSGVVVLFLR
jgi:drug/metabolite transporter (DMT)-like permease